MVVKAKVGKCRYISYRIISKKSITHTEFLRELYSCEDKENLQKMKFRSIFFNGHYGVVKCSHIYKDTIIQLLISIRNISNENVTISTLGTSGTIKKCIQKYLYK